MIQQGQCYQVCLARNLPNL